MKSISGADKSNTEASAGERKLLAAAAALFADRGFDSVSVADISALAGVSKGNLFHHFKSKKNLYLAALKSAGARTTNVPLDGQSADQDPVARLKAHFTGQLSQLTNDSQATRLVLRELLDHGSEHSEELAEEIYVEAFANAVTRVREGQSQGQLRTDFDPGLLAFLLLACNVFYFQAEAMFNHIEDATFVRDTERFSAVAFDLFIHGAAKENS